jgi:hypothetical protein
MHMHGTSPTHTSSQVALLGQLVCDAWRNPQQAKGHLCALQLSTADLVPDTSDSASGWSPQLPKWPSPVRVPLIQR